MIFPGHLAASWLCHRYLRVDLRAAIAATLLPDLLDKLLYHGLHLTPSSRVPMHTLVGWLGSLALITLLSLAWHALRSRPLAPRRSTTDGARTRGTKHASPWAFPLGWGVGHAAHMVCDSPLAGGKIPLLYPFWQYRFVSPSAPLGFILGLDPWPVYTIVVEILLVAVTLYVERHGWVPWAERHVPSVRWRALLHMPAQARERLPVESVRVEVGQR